MRIAPSTAPGSPQSTKTQSDGKTCPPGQNRLPQQDKTAIDRAPANTPRAESKKPYEACQKKQAASTDTDRRFCNFAKIR